MTTHRCWKTTLRLSVVVLQARQWLFRARAEALLADIKSLELNQFMVGCTEAYDSLG
jgi:hypothetical protein